MFYYAIMGDGLECKGEQGTSEVAPKRRRCRLQNVLCVSDKFFFFFRFKSARDWKRGLSHEKFYRST